MKINQRKLNALGSKGLSSEIRIMEPHPISTQHTHAYTHAQTHARTYYAYTYIHD